MRKCVKRWWNVPYGGVWHFKHPITGVEIKGHDKARLIKAAEDHALSNNLPVGMEFNRQVEDEICKSMPNECVDCSETGVEVRPKVLGLNDVLRGTRVMVAHRLAGSPLVDPSESERRASICAPCQWNVTLRLPCTGMCPELERLVKSVVGERRTSRDRELRSCGICHCYLSVAVLLPLETQCLGVGPKERELFKEVPNCWKQCP